MAQLRNGEGNTTPAARTKWRYARRSANRRNRPRNNCRSGSGTIAARKNTARAPLLRGDLGKHAA
eukprot:846106-Lingulodinium_polyedra.AAC.1